MNLPDLVPPKFISLKNHPTLNERWLHNRLIEDPSLLGLGDLDVRGSERRQPSGGRLDLLLDFENPKRYEVEIQLGAMDGPTLSAQSNTGTLNAAAIRNTNILQEIVAEDVTSRFLNVISLLNGAIPLIAIQIKGVEVNGSFTLIATRVVDQTTLGTEEEDAGETIDRASWERHRKAPCI